MCLQELHKPGEYRVTTAAPVSLLQAVTFREASHQDVSELILQRPAYFRELQNVRGVVSELPDAFVQVQQSTHQSKRRPNNGLVRCLRQGTTDDCLGSSGQIINWKGYRAIVKVGVEIVDVRHQIC